MPQRRRQILRPQSFAIVLVPERLECVADVTEQRLLKFRQLVCRLWRVGVHALA